MNTRFLVIIQAIYGRSWQSQLADYLMISRKTVSSWVNRGSVPDWALEKIKPLVDRNSIEAKFAQDSVNSSDSDFCHNYSIISGKSHHYDCKRYNLDDIKTFIESQKWRATEEAKDAIRNGQSVDEAHEIIKDIFLQEDDISDLLDSCDAASEDIELIQELRAEACLDTIFIIDGILDNLKK